MAITQSANFHVYPFVVVLFFLSFFFSLVSGYFYFVHNLDRDLIARRDALTRIVTQGYRGKPLQFGGRN